MKTIKLTKLAKELEINHSAISLWKKNNRIPTSRIFDVAEIINVNPVDLNNNNNLLFDMFNNTTTTATKSSTKTLKEVS